MTALPLALALIAGLSATPDADRTRCEASLKGIGRALDSYRAEHRQYPDKLTDLVPKYLPERKALLCPADTTGGTPGSGFGHRDPKGDVSYSYELNNAVANGTASPLGNPPPSDLGGAGGWGTERNVQLWLKAFYGDRVPSVRCFHHTRDDSRNVLSLTLGGDLIEGLADWERDADSVRTLVERARRAVEGDPEDFDAAWRVTSLYDRTRDWSEAADHADVRAAMVSACDAFRRQAPRLKDSETALRLAARLGLLARDYRRAEACARAVLASVEGNEPARVSLAEALRGQGRIEEAATLYADLLANNPKARSLRVALAESLAAHGQHDDAERIIAEMDRGRPKVGQLAPEFRVPTLDGRELNREVAMKGAKALLVMFWSLDAPALKASMAKLQAISDEMKGKGLAVLAIDDDDDPERVASYAKSGRLTVPIGLSMSAPGQVEVAPLFGVDVVPCLYLLDAEGRVAFRCLVWDEAGLRKALADLGIK